MRSDRRHLLAWLALAALALPPAARAAAADAPPAAATVRAVLELRLDPAARTLEGRGAWTLPAGSDWRMVLDARFEPRRLVVDGREQAHDSAAVGGLREWRFATALRERRVEVDWHGRLDALDPGLDHRAVLTHRAPVASPRGSFLPGVARWHPVFEDAGLDYRVTLDLPEDQRGIVPGQRLDSRVLDGRRLETFAFRQPYATIDLMAGPWVLTERSYAAAGGRRIALRSLVHPELAPRADGDLEAVARYLGLYESWIGPYPYTDFSIVSSPTPTGFGMPTLTYLGVEVLRLPFIRDTSLGHEVLHNWWGNGVRVADGGGNWAEGLTTFMADHAYRERAAAAAARELRLGWLRDFAALERGADRPLAGFTARTHGASQVVGYHKSAMVFLMLRDAIGEDAFDRGLRAFWSAHAGQGASWQDLRAAFEQASGRDLDGFFAQWLERPGAPRLRLESARLRPGVEGWTTEVTLAQDAPPWRLRVPVSLEFADGSSRTHWLELQDVRGGGLLETRARPVAVTLDPDARAFRRLLPDEAPPILRQAMLDPRTAVVLAGAESTGAELARRLLEHAPAPRPAAQPPPVEPLLLIGLEPGVDRYLARHGLPGRPAQVAVEPGRATARAWTLARPGAGPLVVVAARDAAALAALLRPLPHHGRQSWLVFEGATAIARGTWPSRPQRIELSDAPAARGAPHPR